MFVSEEKKVQTQTSQPHMETVETERWDPCVCLGTAAVRRAVTVSLLRGFKKAATALTAVNAEIKSVHTK